VRAERERADMTNNDGLKTRSYPSSPPPFSLAFVSVWDPFSNTEWNFRVPNDCSFTDADALKIHSLLSECSLYFSASVDNLLVQCAGAAQNVDPINHPNVFSEEYLMSFAKVIDCSGKIPSRCLRGDGAGVMESLLSLLPFETTQAFKDGKQTNVNMVRIMVPVSGEQRAHTEWKMELMEELNKVYFYENGKKALGGGDKGVR